MEFSGKRCVGLSCLERVKMSLKGCGRVGDFGLRVWGEVGAIHPSGLRTWLKVQGL